MQCLKEREKELKCLKEQNRVELERAQEEMAGLLKAKETEEKR